MFSVACAGGDDRMRMLVLALGVCLTGCKQAPQGPQQAVAREKPGVVTRQELDTYQAQESQALASLHLAKANLDSARLNLEWTKVVAPVSGRVSRTLVTVGNLVQAGNQSGGTLLTTLVS